MARLQGRIHATPATRDVAELILLDSGTTCRRRTRSSPTAKYSRHAPALPLYRVVDAERALARFSDVALHRETALPGGATLTLRHAGHILERSHGADRFIGGMRVVFPAIWAATTTR